MNILLWFLGFFLAWGFLALVTKRFIPTIRKRYYPIWVKALLYPSLFVVIGMRWGGWGSGIVTGVGAFVIDKLFPTQQRK